MSLSLTRIFYTIIVSTIIVANFTLLLASLSYEGLSQSYTNVGVVFNSIYLIVSEGAKYMDEITFAVLQLFHYSTIILAN
jgi:hypothetical protein